MSVMTLSFQSGACDLFLAPMLPEYKGEIEVLYLNEDERTDFEIRVVRGNLVFSDQEPLPEGAKFQYVLSKEQKFYLAPLGGSAGELRFRHSSFMAGEAVLAAGQGKFENGIIHLNRSSGHYHPSFKHLFQLGQWLVGRGFSAQKIVLYDNHMTLTGGFRMSELTENQHLLDRTLTGS